AAAAWEWWPQALSDAARRFGVAVVAGGFAPADAPADSGPAARLVAALGEGAPGRATGAGGIGRDARVWNVLLAVDADGGVVGAQPKTRLYDAFSYRESEMVRPGGPGAGAPVKLAGLSLGLVNCYELRFPELARGLVAGGAEVLALSAAWVRGPLKEDQWATLARARAIENCVYVLAAGARTRETIGRSMIIDPGGVVRAGLSDEPEALALAEIDTAAIAAARAQAGSAPAPGS
ncbi:MAG: hypothetical protein LBD70_08730, partial [Bifidobacteriaceae bacterium]|nr:hypothetical protein [Bifidobacteriaceae bacterium]